MPHHPTHTERRVTTRTTTLRTKPWRAAIRSLSLRGLGGRGALTLLAAAALSACGGGTEVLNQVPGFVHGSVSVVSYDGSSDDLLTAGLGRTGLAGAAPAYANPAAPTAAELRRNAIHTNYRALIDYTAAGGYGSFYGPNIDATGADTLGEGKIAGTEHLAVVDDGSGRRNEVLMVQLPASFDARQPCIVTAASSGSRGIYGAIGTAGDWGLKHGCAVAYTDKGSGNGFHDLQSDAVTRIDGTLSTAAVAGTAAHFRAPMSEAERAAFTATSPQRVAYKHAHSGQNPEADWGLSTLQAVQFAFYVINQQHGLVLGGDPSRRSVSFYPANTLVIASSVSNGAGAALAAAELDRSGLIDGVAVAEPQVQAGSTAGLTLRQGSHTVSTVGKPLLDYFTYANLYQPCALLSPQTTQTLSAAFWPAAYASAAQNRCTALAALGLLIGSSTDERANDALARLRAYGWGAESDGLHQSHFRFATNSIAVTYANSYGRFGVADKVCGYSFANTNASGAVVPQVATTQAGLFASGNGVPPTSGVNVVFDDAVGGPTLDFLATSAGSGSADFALDGALCLRALATGRDPVTGTTLTGTRKTQSDRVLAGMQAVQRTGRLQGKPTVIVAGRNDALIPVNHAARAYYGQHLLAEGGTATRYYEVTNAQHFDTFIAFGALLGYDTRYVPLHVYFNRAMDLMWAHLRSGTPLPASQVVRTAPRTAGASLTGSNVPPIAATPLPADTVSYSAGTLSVPE